MLHYTEYQPIHYTITKKSKKSRSKCEDVFTLDTETSSVYVTRDEEQYRWRKDLPRAIWHDKYGFDSLKDFYNDCEKFGFVYIWMLSINGIVYYGRELDELPELLEMIHKDLKGARWKCYVHNLPYDFQFLQNVLEVDKLFCRDKRNVMYCYIKKYGLYLYDSYVLTNMSLADIGEVYKLDSQKMVGDLDYDVIRTPETPMTEKELAYCEHDCTTLTEYLQKIELAEYKSVWNIPTTQTGKVRRNLKERIDEEYPGGLKNWYKMTQKMQPDGVLYKYLVDAFSGGYVHGNVLYRGETIETVDSHDLTSAYPYVMFAYNYPTGPFTDISSVFSADYIYKITDADTEDRAYLLDITFYKVKCKLWNTYQSRNKCQVATNCVLDNGRIESADEMRTVITEQDLLNIRADYNFESVKIHKIYTAAKKPLPSVYLKTIVFFFTEKNKYKHDAQHKILYLNRKEKLNSLYGMCCTRTITDKVTYDKGEWKVETLDTIADIEEELKEQEFKTLLPLQWGIWIPAYVRRTLWKIIPKIDDIVTYGDTDSLKHKRCERADRIFEEANKEIADRVYKVAQREDIDFEPIKTLGTFDVDGRYDKFRTLGAKKYVTEEDGELCMTLSGVSKEAVRYLKNIDDFAAGKVFNEEQCGKVIRFYRDTQREITVHDEDGKEYTVHHKHGICLMPTTYKLGVNTKYDDELNGIIEERKSTGKVFDLPNL